MTVDYVLSLIPADFYDALAALWPVAAGGFIVGVGVWLVAMAFRVGFDIMRGNSE